MLTPLLNVRLVVIDSLNDTPEEDRSTTAQAWVDILELESARLTEGAADWLPVGAAVATPLRRRHPDRWHRMLGQTDARLSLIIADQVVAALIRGHLSG